MLLDVLLQQDASFTPDGSALTTILSNTRLGYPVLLARVNGLMPVLRSCQSSGSWSASDTRTGGQQVQRACTYVDAHEVNASSGPVESN